MRLVDVDGNYTINASDNTLCKLCFSGGIICVMDEDGHIVCEFFTDDIPTVDAVEVVRCGDCIYCEKAYLYSTAEVDKNDKCCALNERLTNDDYFCPYGERR